MYFNIQLNLWFSQAVYEVSIVLNYPYSFNDTIVFLKMQGDVVEGEKSKTLSRFRAVLYGALAVSSWSCLKRSPCVPWADGSFHIMVSYSVLQMYKNCNDTLCNNITCNMYIKTYINTFSME